MTSVTRTIAVKKEGLTLFVKPDSPAYLIGDAEDDPEFLFPFSYSNQILDISYEGNNFESRMVDVTGQSPRSEADTAIRILSGPYLATSLGENFKAYIRSWRSSTIDAGSPIEINIAPQLLRVQEASYDNIDARSGDFSSWSISTSVPASENYISGTVANNYNTTYIFKTPLTFTIIESGVKKYITFKTVLDQE